MVNHLRRQPEQINLNDGQKLRLLSKRVREYTWDVGLPFVKRRLVKLPAGAWVGTVSKIGPDVAAISSKYFYGYQLPAPGPVMDAVRTLFK